MVHRLDRLGRGGGGVAIYVSDQYDSVICSTSVDNRDYELLWVLVKRRLSVILVGGLYHPQSIPIASKPSMDTSRLHWTIYYMLVGSAIVHTVTDEFKNIPSWTGKKNPKIHPNKTKEIIFSRRRFNVQYPPDPFISGAERVDAVRVLRVALLPRGAMEAHLDRVTANCACSRFALRTLRAHGLSPPELHLVTRMTAVSSLMCASPSWWGFTDASDRSRLERQLAKLRRTGFLPLASPSFDELARNADAGMFRSICSNPDHVPRHYFTDKRPTGHNSAPEGS